MPLEKTEKYLKIGKSILHNMAGEDQTPVVLKVLREYMKSYHPKKWLFEGVKEGKHITTRTAEKKFSRTPVRKQESPKRLHSTASGTVLQRIYWKMVQILDTFRNFYLH